MPGTLPRVQAAVAKICGLPEGAVRDRWRRSSATPAPRTRC
jgi:hypothetical protein